MAVRPKEPKQGNIAAAAAVLVLAGWFAAPVLAAPDLGIAETTATTIDSVADDHLLKTRVEATAREVFADSVDDSDTEEVVDIDSEDGEVTEPRLRPMSENELAPFRRQMYRKDI